MASLAALVLAVFGAAFWQHRGDAAAPSLPAAAPGDAAATASAGARPAPPTPLTALLPAAPIAAEREPIPTPPPVSGATPVRLTIEVRRAGGAAATDVPLSLTAATNPDPFQAPIEVRSDANGVATVALLPGEWNIAAAAGGEATVRLLAGQDAAIRMVLPDGFTVLGHVRDTGGNGIADAEVLVTNGLAPLRAFCVARTDRNGAFAVPDLHGFRCLLARHPDYAPSLQYAVRAEPGRTVRQTILLHGRPGRLHGIVRDADGAPVPGAELLLGDDTPTLQPAASATGNTYRSPAIFVVADGDGRFRSPDLPAGPVRVSARAPLHGPVQVMVEVFAGVDTACDLELTRGATVAGIVRDGDGAPTVAVLWSGNRYGFDSVRTWSGADGRFTLPGLPAGTVALSAQAAAQPDAVDAVELQLAPGGNAVWNPELADRRLPAIAGLVCDRGGNGLQGWTIVPRAANTAGLRSARSGKDGAFVLRPLPERAVVDLHVHAPAPPGSGLGFAVTVLRDVAVGNHDVRLVIDDLLLAAEQRGRVLGTVVDPDGAGVAAEISIWHDERREYAAFTTANDGSFAVGHVPPGTIQIAIRTAEHPQLHLPNCVLAPAAELDLGQLRLEVGAAVFGQLIGPDGAPPLAAHVTLYSGSRTIRGEYANGSYRVAPAPVGEHQLVIQGQGFGAVRRPVTLLPRQQHQVDVTLERGVPRQFRIEVPAGQACGPTVSLTLEPDDAPSWLGNTPLRAGAAEFTAWMVPGRYRATAWSGGCHAEATVVFAADATEPVTLVLRRR